MKCKMIYCSCFDCTYKEIACVICGLDEYILPKIAERDLRRFANLRCTSSHLGVQLPLDKVILCELFVLTNLLYLFSLLFFCKLETVVNFNAIRTTKACKVEKLLTNCRIIIIVVKKSHV